MTIDEEQYRQEFAGKARVLEDERELALLAWKAQERKDSEAFYRIIFSVWYFHKGWSWQQARAEVIRIMKQYPPQTQETTNATHHI